MKVGTDGYTYELIEDFAKLPEGQTFGLISRLTTDSQNRLYVFQRKDPAVLVFVHGGSWRSIPDCRSSGLENADGRKRCAARALVRRLASPAADGSDD